MDAVAPPRGPPRAPDAPAPGVSILPATQSTQAAHGKQASCANRLAPVHARPRVLRSGTVSRAVPPCASAARFPKGAVCRGNHSAGRPRAGTALRIVLPRYCARVRRHRSGLDDVRRVEALRADWEDRGGRFGRAATSLYKKPPPGWKPEGGRTGKTPRGKISGWKSLPAPRQGARSARGTASRRRSSGRSCGRTRSTTDRRRVRRRCPA